MTQHTHTPGPWNWDAHGRLFARETVCPWPLVIAQGGAIDADMRLIAAAPALLAALERIVEQAGTSFHYGSKASAELADIARAALAAARGEG